jgi:protein-S-isoprenylcysteine O-methyltransferase Ste14
MTVAALGLFAVYLSAAFGLRTWLQWRRTGDTGWRGISGRPFTSEWWAGVLFAAALAAGVAGPVAALAGLAPLATLDATAVHATGTLLAVAGISATLASQLDMGASWRIGVDEAERTELVTTGLFAWVRNPIFTFMALTGLGLAAMTPNLVSLSGVVVLAVALQLQVRVVEEPYLRVAHGAAYTAYAAATGRFLPGLGKLPAATASIVDLTGGTR